MPIPDGDPVFSAKVEIVLHDGTTLQHYQAGFRGHPSHPATAAQVEGKFRENTLGLITAGRADALVTAITNLQSCATVRTVTGLLGTGDHPER
jgi:2-methylcitrate dehydratase PrpD